MAENGYVGCQYSFLSRTAEYPFLSMRERIFSSVSVGRWTSNCRCQIVSEDAKRINSDASKPRSHVVTVTTLLGQIQRAKIKCKKKGNETKFDIILFAVLCLL